VKASYRTYLALCLSPLCVAGKGFAYVSQQGDCGWSDMKRMQNKVCSYLPIIVL
jgi:hypothetical protein